MCVLSQTDSDSLRVTFVSGQDYVCLLAFSCIFLWVVHEHLMYTNTLNQGWHDQGKKSGKRKFFQVREKSGNFGLSQGNWKKLTKVREKSGNFKIFWKLRWLWQSLIFRNINLQNWSHSFVKWLFYSLKVRLYWKIWWLRTAVRGVGRPSKMSRKWKVWEKSGESLGILK